MFRVTADSLGAYLDFDPERKPDLVKLHKLMAKTAPVLKRYFHKGTPAGEAGMRMKMIGYGRFRYAIKSGKTTEWPVIGVALQKNYISVYMSVTKAGAPLVPAYEGKLGELRMGGNNFSFVRFDDLRSPALSSLVAEAHSIFRSDPENPVRYMQGMQNQSSLPAGLPMARNGPTGRTDDVRSFCVGRALRLRRPTSEN